MFDTVTYLESKHIQYWTEGKNISSGWIGIQCVFCNDHSNHLGINIESGIFSCWICGEKGNVTKLVKEIESCSWYRAKEIVESGQDIFSTYKPPFVEDDQRWSSEDILPKTSQDNLPKIHTEYLISRNFSPEYLIHKYKIKAVHTIGKYRFRIIAPFFLRSKIVSFVARDVTGLADKPYLACPNRRGKIPLRSTLYNIDTVRDSVVVVEGVTDVWRIGDGAVASAGLNLTSEQMSQLLEREVKKAFVVFDTGKEDVAMRYGNDLSSVINTVEVVTLPDGDPADQEEEIVKEIRGLLK